MTINEIHIEAMYKAELGDIHKQQGKLEEARAYYAEAYSLEQKAAHVALNGNLGEPTVSILLKSSASLALRCNFNRDAEKLISLALSGEPPIDIAEELRDMLETVHFNRHLELKGMVLKDDEVRLVIAGKGVGFGLAKSNEALERIEIYEKLTGRTIERKSGRKFRKTGVVPGELKNLCQSYISAPQVASMAFTIKFGGLGVTTMSGFSSFEDVIDDINNNIELLNNGNIEEIKNNIPDESYLNNFIAYAKILAPDGNDISLFGITSNTRGVERKVEFRSKRSEISSIIKCLHLERNGGSNKNESEESAQSQTIVGILSAADSSGTVKITTQDNKKVVISVPDGLSEIVRTYWEQNVSINYVEEGLKKKILLDIDPSE